MRLFSKKLDLFLLKVPCQVLLLEMSVCLVHSHQTRQILLLKSRFSLISQQPPPHERCVLKVWHGWRPENTRQGSQAEVRRAPIDGHWEPCITHWKHAGRVESEAMLWNSQYNFQSTLGNSVGGCRWQKLSVAPQLLQMWDMSTYLPCLLPSASLSLTHRWRFTWMLSFETLG